MKTRDFEERKRLSRVELLAEVEQTKLTLQKLRQQWRTGQLKDTALLRRTKKDIARLLTLAALKK